jgi:uncharacterized protein (DUF169 family)
VKTLKKPQNMRVLEHWVVNFPLFMHISPTCDLRRFTWRRRAAAGMLFNCILGGHMATDTVNWQQYEARFSGPLRLARRPVAVTFLDAAPANMERFSHSEPSGCSFWRLAAEGRVFYTVPADHFNCAVGSYTLNIPLSPEREKETEQTLQLMFGVGYIRPEDVPGIPRLSKTPAAIAFAPLGAAPLAPSVVLFACRPAAAMLLNEAAMRVGSGGTLPPLGRPSCMALPAALEKGTVSSLGCAGNRVYTGLGDDELYVAVPGNDLGKVAEALDTIISANQAIEEYARGRRVQLSTL